MRKGTAVVSRGRMLVVVALLGIAATALVAKAAVLQVGEASFLRKQGDARTLRVEPLAATRGLILDRNGQPLAVSTPVVSIWANPPQMMDHRDQWRAIARKLGLDYEDLKDRVLRAQDREFVYLRRHLAPEAAKVILDAKFPGIYGTTEYRRYYPSGEVAAHVVGFTNVDDEGQEGIELAQEQVLRAHQGQRRVVKDLNGRVVEDVELVEDAVPGRDVTLSIDLRIQYLAYRELAAEVMQQHAAGGSVVVVDVDTGEILAMANQPSYNPNNRAHVQPGWLRNRAATDVFEPGSTMKTFTIATALESGKYKPTTLIDTAPGKLKIGDRVISDHENYGLIDVTTVLTKSSNVGASKISLSLDPNTLVGTFERAGFGSVTGVGFPGESAGKLPHYTRWRPIDQASMSYGYSLNVTVLQLAEAYATVASGGIHRSLTLMRRDEVPAGERVFQPEIAHELVEMLRTVTTDEGTAARARINGYSVAGKTGTVHKLVGGGYSENEYLGLFAGMAPAMRPRVVTIVVIDNPQSGQYYGGQIAAPVFSTITAGALRTLNVSPDAVPQLASGKDAGRATL